MERNPETCFACGKGRYRDVVKDYTIELPEGEVLTVRDLRVLCCDKCGEETIPPESSRRIESVIDRQQDTLPPNVVHSFLEQFEIDQTQAAEVLGLGAKTIHRWVHGTQRVSRSMGYFLRTVMAHPAVFEWLRDRRWRHTASESDTLMPAESGGYWAADYRVRFPASGGKPRGISACPAPQALIPPFNPVRAFQVASFR